MAELSPVDELYREVVLDHYRNPRHRAPLAEPDASALVHNPLCGDQVLVEVCIENGRIRDVSARSRGCSIAVAAGSVMAELVGGLGAAQVAELREGLAQLVNGEPGGAELDRALRAFERVADLPSRRRCALLPWEALEEALAGAL